MDQHEINLEEEQSPLHIKREQLDIDIPYKITFPQCQQKKDKETPKTAIRTNIEHLEPEEIMTETTPKTQIDVSSPRVPFLTHSQIMSMNQDDDDMAYSKSGLNNPLSEIPEEQTPSYIPSQTKISQDFNIENISMVNSQQMKFSKKSSDKDSVISRLEMENSKLREELKEQVMLQEQKIKDLERENFVLKKKGSQERVKQLEMQLETEYKITTLTEQMCEQEEQYTKQIIILKSELQAAKLQLSLIKQQQQDISMQQQISSQLQTLSQSQMSAPGTQPIINQQNNQQKQPFHVSLSQSFTEYKSNKDTIFSQLQNESIFQRIVILARMFDQNIDVSNKDINELLQWITNKLKIILRGDEEEKIDEHRSIIQSLKSELGEIKQLRNQLSKIYIDYDQFQNKKGIDSINDQKYNELNLQLLGIKQEKFDLLEVTKKQAQQLQSKDQIINELQQKLINLAQTDTIRKQSQFVKQLQTNSMVDLKVIKESLKQRQEGLKKSFKSQNSPQSRSHNPSPTLKFLNSPKNSNQGSAQQENKSGYYNKTSDFREYSKDFIRMESSQHATSNSLNNDMIQKLVDQFRGNTSFAQRLSNYQKRI